MSVRRYAEAVNNIRYHVDRTISQFSKVFLFGTDVIRGVAGINDDNWISLELNNKESLRLDSNTAIYREEHETYALAYTPDNILFKHICMLFIHRCPNKKWKEFCNKLTDNKDFNNQMYEYFIKLKENIDAFFMKQFIFGVITTSKAITYYPSLKQSVPKIVEARFFLRDYFYEKDKQSSDDMKHTLSILTMDNDQSMYIPLSPFEQGLNIDVVADAVEELEKNVIESLQPIESNLRKNIEMLFKFA